MERHAAIPHFENINRVGKDRGLVEKYIAEPPTQNNTKRRVKDHIVRMPPRQRGAGLDD